MSKGKLLLGKFELFLSLAIVFLSVFSIITLIISPEPDYGYLMARNIRLLLSTLTIGLTFKYVFHSKDEFLKILGLVLLTHVSSIYIQLIVPSTKPYFANFVLYSKNLFDGRNFGLVNGYESTALLSLLAFTLYLATYFKERRLYYLFLALFALCSCFFISRTAILLVFIIGLFIAIFYHKYLKTRNMIVLLPIGLVAIIWLAKLFIPLLFGSIPELREMFPEIAINYPMTDPEKTGYSKQSFTYLTSTMLVFPKGLPLIFGSGNIPPSDIGYIKLLFLYGILGAITVVGIYLYMIFKTYKLVLINFSFYGIRYKMIIEVLIILIIILNFKGLFFFTRIAHEIILLIVLSVNSFILKTTPELVPDENRN